MIGKKIDDIRGSMSYNDFAKAIGDKTGTFFHPTTLHKYVTGQRKPSLSNLKVIAEFAKKPVDYFYERPGNTNPYAANLLALKKNIGEMLNVTYFPIIDHLDANFHQLSEETIRESLSLPTGIFQTSENIFILRVKGNNAFDSGLKDGDFVAIRKQSYAENGQLVFAKIKNSTVLKRYFHEQDHVRLLPPNTDQPEILSKDVEVLGVVALVINRFE